MNHACKVVYERMRGNIYVYITAHSGSVLCIILVGRKFVNENIANTPTRLKARLFRVNESLASMVGVRVCAELSLQFGSCFGFKIRFAKFWRVEERIPKRYSETDVWNCGCGFSCGNFGYLEKFCCSGDLLSFSERFVLSALKFNQFRTLRSVKLVRRLEKQFVL